MNRKPLVLIDGEFVAMPSGDVVDPASLPASSSPATVQMTNGNAGALVIGTPVYCKSNGDADKGSTSNADSAELVGLVSDTTIASAAVGNVQTSGQLSASTAQWDALLGTTGGLTPGSDYFLNTSGSMGVNPSGPRAVKCGKALSTQKFLIRIEPSVQVA